MKRNVHNVFSLIHLCTVFSFFLLITSSAPFCYAYSDLSVEWVKVDKEVVGEGEIVEIKAKVKNLNVGVSRAFAVSFYYDVTDSEHLIGRIYYDSINYYRIPSIKWDTKNKEGKHKIIVHVSDDNEENNYGYCDITILPTRTKAKLLLEEIYYHARPHRNNEYLCIMNAGDKSVDLNGWYVTTQPWKRADKQNKIIFPNIILKPGEKLYVTQNATAFEFETGFWPDYEYYNCSSIPDLKREGRFIMANDGGVICLKDAYNHTIDVVVYGNAYFNEGWTGNAIKKVEKGVVLKRNGCIDTNTSEDWEYNRTFIIGQSDFGVWHGKASKAIAFCSPDCSYKIISEEIESADELLINLYTFTNPFLAEILNESNATVKLLLDGNVIGGIPMEERWIAYMLSKKHEVRYMFGDEENDIYKRYRYNHAKYVVYGNRCIIESANWGKSGIPVNPSYGNREWGIVIESEDMASFLKNVFEYDWNPDFQDSIEFNESSFTHGKPPSDFSISYYIPHGDYTPAFPPFHLNNSFNVTIILSPDNAEEEIKKLIDGAKEEILIEQAYIEKEWSNGINPFIKKIVEKNESGVAVRVILNDNPAYISTSAMNKETSEFLRGKGIEMKLQRNINIHNKGMIVDGCKVLISSINWGENSVRNNREIGVIIENEDIAAYFEQIFWYDWNYEVGEKENMPDEIFLLPLFAATFLIIYLYRKR